jgi:FMN phosphatase YigB (HAD superfamily)
MITASVGVAQGNTGVSNRTDGLRCIVVDFNGTLCSDRYFKTGPAGCCNWRALFEQHVFSDQKRLTDWCTGKLRTGDIAQIISSHTGLPRETVVAEMRKGCQNLAFNQEVVRFVELQRRAGRKAALVTGNMDVFTEVVAPFHHLDRAFDVIVNSADYGTDDKLALWQVAFDKIGTGVAFRNSLLIDDSEKWTRAFEAQGGTAHRYVSEEGLRQWILISGAGDRGARPYGGKVGISLLSKAQRPGQPVGVAHQNLDDPDAASPRHPATPTA